MLMNLQTAAKELGGISVPTLRRRIQSGEIPTVRVGRRVLISRQALEAFIKNASQQSPRGNRLGQL